jgi:hypothetical protein
VRAVGRQRLRVLLVEYPYVYPCKRQIFGICLSNAASVDYGLHCTKPKGIAPLQVGRVYEYVGRVYEYVVQQIAEKVSSSEFPFTIIVTIIISVFVPRRSRAVQTLPA